MSLLLARHSYVACNLSPSVPMGPPRPNLSDGLVGDTLLVQHAPGGSCNNPLVLALLLVPWLLAVNPPVAEKSVWVLQGTGWQREETALLFALRIYTRDLKVPITISVLPSQGETHEDQRNGAESRCALDASLVVWFAGEEAAPHLCVLRCASGEEYQLPLLPPQDRELAAQTLALKIRGLLTDVAPAEVPIGDFTAASGRNSQAASDQSGSSSVSPDLGQGLGAAASVANASPGGTPTGAGDHASRLDGATKQRPTVEGGLDWVYGVTNSFAKVRQGLLLRLAVVSRRLPLAAEMDGAVVTSITKGTAGYQMSVTESPITGIALSARLTRRWWTVSVGPRVSLHYISAEGYSPDGRAGSLATFAVGLGALERILFNASDTVSLALSVSNEVLVPHRRFTLDGRSEFDVGNFHWAASAGVVVHP